MKNRFLLLVFLLLAFTGFSQTFQDTLALIEKSMLHYLPENPGAQLSIQKNGRIIFSKAYGLADMEHDVPLTLTSKIEAGSVSKQFAAAAILLLQQQGKLSIHDDVRKYVPELPDYGNVITIEQLIHHTSGLRDWGTVASLTGWKRTTKAYTNDDALEIIKAQQSLNNIPGAEFIYSNSNYNLMAILVQRISGQTLAEFTTEHIFQPAGMKNTEWRDDYKRIVKHRAKAYAYSNNSYETLMPNEDVYGNGGLLTTTEDLLKWNDFYLSGKMGSSSVLEEQMKLVAFNNGVMSDYGAGIYIQEYNGHTLIQHGGATAGYRAFLEVYPELKLSIAFLSNTSRYDAIRPMFIAGLRKIFIGERKEAPIEDIKPYLPSEKTKAFIGWYRNERDGSALYFEYKNNQYTLNNTKLTPLTDRKFKFTNSDRMIEFSNNNQLKYIYPGKDTVLYTREVAGSSSTKYLQTFEGNYYSEETKSAMDIRLHNGKLTLTLKPNLTYTLIPTYHNAFNIPGMNGNIRFSGTHALISISRARNVKFERN